MKSKLTLSIFFFALLFSCNKKEPIVDPPVGPTEPEETVIERIDGVIQKGPFLNGTAITVFELENDFSPTGRSFASEIKDNSGSYTLQNISLVSEFIELRASGFYFNEVLNRNSQAQLTLSAISDVTNRSSLNINLLSTLEKDRVKTLIEQGSDFAAAKSQVQSEILNIFEIAAGGATESELRDISKAGDENAMLLAVSLILQGAFENVAELSQLVANIKSDIADDGTLDDEAIGTILVNNAKKLNLSEIRENLEQKFQDLGLSGAVVPSFEKYVNDFLANTSFSGTSGISYPEMGDNGPNVLHPDFKESQIRVPLSIIANLEEGTHLRIKIYMEGTWLTFSGMQQNSGWERTVITSPERIDEYESSRTGTLDLAVSFFGPQGSDRPNNTAVIELFENYQTTPSRRIEILITDVIPKIHYPDYGDYGTNIFNNNFLNPHFDDFSASMATELLRDTMEVFVKIQGGGWDYDPTTVEGWIVSDLNQADRSRTFKTDGSGSYDMKFDFYKVPPNPDSTASTQETIIELFENGSTTPNRRFGVSFH